MDVNDFRNLVTLLSFVLFGVIVKWAWSRRNKAAFHEAEMLPFLEDAPAATPPENTRPENRHE
jgi:cbb3-type cytochrome oxidase subunit 3